MSNSEAGNQTSDTIPPELNTVISEEISKCRNSGPSRPGFRQDFSLRFLATICLAMPSQGARSLVH